LESFLSRRPEDSAQHSPGSPWHVKKQHQKQQLFLNRRAALFRPSKPMAGYVCASIDHRTAKSTQIKKALKMPTGRY